MRCKQDPKKSPQKGLGLPIAEGEELDIKAPAVRGPGGRSPYCSGPPTRSWALTKRAVWVETEAGQTVPPEVSISRTFPCVFTRHKASGGLGRRGGPFAGRTLPPEQNTGPKHDIG